MPWHAAAQGAAVQLAVQLPEGSLALQNTSWYSYQLRLWSANFLYVGTAEIDSKSVMHVSARVRDGGQYTLLVTRFNSACTQCGRPAEFVYAANISVKGDLPHPAALRGMPSCSCFTGSDGRWARRAALCAGEAGESKDDKACSFPTANGASGAWLWLPFACAYRPPALHRALKRNVTLAFLGDSTFRFLWGPFVSLFEEDPDQRFKQHGYGRIRSSRLSRRVWGNESLRSHWQRSEDTDGDDATQNSVNSDCDWESNYFLWRRGRLRIAYGHPFWTCHNRVQCQRAKRCHLRPDENRRHFDTLVDLMPFDYVVGATSDTASDTGCSQPTLANAQLEAVTRLRAVQGARVHIERRSLVGFMPDNGARLHCVNAGIAAKSHAAFGRSPNAPIFNSSIDTFTLSNAVYHFSRADAALVGGAGQRAGGGGGSGSAAAAGSIPYFFGDGIHAGSDVNTVLATMLAVHIFECALREHSSRA